MFVSFGKNVIVLSEHIEIIINLLLTRQHQKGNIHGNGPNWLKKYTITWIILCSKRHIFSGHRLWHKRHRL